MNIHKIFTIIIALFLCTFSQVAPNFTASDINGTKHDLYTLLEAGNWVMLDFTTSDGT